jgi:hypothetical protein|tara:strand:+ start:113 stop:499 length:387 start_codon:yes stop_codon:yes gene_type:complete
MKRTLSLIGVVLVVGCGGPEPRDMGTLRGVDGLYLNPEDDQPYSGPVFGENNGKRMTGSLRDGKWDGPFESYHENGQLRRRGTYKDGVEDGPVEEYYDNGQLYEKGSYKDGEPCGEWFEGRTVTHDPC